MNFSVISGIIAAVFMLVFMVLESATGIEVFLNKEGMVVVIGGTIAASLLIFPFSNYTKMVKVFWNKVLLGRGVKTDDIIREILSLSKGMRRQPDYLKANVNSIKVPFLKDAVELINKGGMTIEEIEEILKKRVDVQFEKYEEESEVFKTLSRFPPAFGLMGTTFGMISLMRSLGGENSFNLIGPAMGVALVATLYGIGISNLILVPFSERLARMNREDTMMKAMVVDGIKLLYRRAHPLLVEEHLLSFMLPGARGEYNRNRLKEVA